MVPMLCLSLGQAFHAHPYRRPCFLPVRCSTASAELWKPCEGAAAAHEAPSSPAHYTTPLLSALQASAAQDIAAFHFPGHGRGAAAPPSLTSLLGTAPFAHDLPELPEFDADQVMAKSQAHAAALFGAQTTHFLVNGSTCGIHAAVLATCSPEQVLILPRNSHVSAISALVLSGASPRFVLPAYDPRWDVAHGVSPEAVAMEIQKQGSGKVGAVLITSPTYYGVCSDVKQIAEICHQHGVPLIVDEAHGAHFCFHSLLPPTALEQGADIAVQSTHKVLTSLTQTGMLHVNKEHRVNTELLQRCLQLLHTTSPNHLLLASLDAACAQMSSSNAPFHHALQLALASKAAIKKIPGLTVLEIEHVKEASQQTSNGLDPLRITVGFSGLRISGFKADEILCRKHLVVAELPSLRSLTFAINLGTSHRDVRRLIEGLQCLSDENFGQEQQEPAFDVGASSAAFQSAIARQRAILTPREAFFAKMERVPAKDAQGLVCAELVCPYPPGIPVLIPGELISEEALIHLKDIMKKGGIIFGASDLSLNSLLVCKLTKGATL